MSGKRHGRDILTGRNAVTEAIKNGREIDKLLIGKDASGSINKIKYMAKDKKIPVYYRERKALDTIAGSTDHQNVVAFVSPYNYCDIKDMLELAEKRGEAPFVIILDGLEDPHNLGAVMRSAEGAGAHGVVISKRRSVGITDTVVKSSAGACEYMKCAKTSNIVSAVKKLKDAGLWIGACDMDGEIYHESNLTGPIGLVIGNEGKGISRLVKENCDFTISIPMRGKVGSLNASNAAAIIMYEVDRQRGIDRK